MDNRRIAELFDHVVELPVGERETWLSAACAGDAELRAEIDRLLRADARAGGFMERPPSDATALIDGAAESPLRFGAYRVVRSLGAGGMGEVWLAERGDGEFEQRVAIKQVAYPTPGLLRRFRQERQILARLDHPNIARLIDGGVGADGAPYLVMEYVEGMPITAFASAHALDVSARLRLFLHVCEAVQFAHRNLVVHRDLKPSNIFVTADGMPKLLDFGIAKVLTTTDADAPTQTVARLLTPAYAAPEQFSGAPVTTATDVYALGVLLYELLAGTRPANGGRAAGNAREPPAPSLAVGNGGDGGIRAVSRRALRGDLDRIALTALAVEPERRYSSAEALAADIRCHLEGRPIAARGGAGYHFARFAWRHRYALGAAVLVVVVSLAAAIVSIGQARHAREQAARAEAARGFIESVFEQADPDENEGRSFTAQQLLEKGEARLAGEATDPVIAADMTGLIGSLYWNIGSYTRALPLLERAVALGEGAAVPDGVRARNLLRLARSEAERSLYAPASTHVEQALELAARSHSETELAGARRLQVQVLSERGDAALAEAAARRLIAEDTARHGAGSRELAQDWALLAHALDELSRYDESIAAERAALAIDRERLGGRSTTVASDLNDLGLALSHKGDYIGAEEALREALDIKIERYGHDHRETMAARANLFMAQEKQGRYEEGLRGRVALLEDQRRVLGVRHADEIARAQNMIGLDCLMLGRFAEAEASFRQALATWAGIDGAEEEERIGPLGNLAIALQLEGDFAQAENAMRSTLAIDRKSYPADSEWLNQDRGYLGNLLRLQHRHTEAVDELSSAVAAVAGAARHSDPVIALLHAQLAEAELDAGFATKAHATASKGLAVAREALPPRNIGLANPLFALARADLALDRFADAEALLREALEVRHPLAPHDPRVLEIKVALVRVLESLGLYAEPQRLRSEIEPLLVASASPYMADLRARLAAR
jgi:serine/threonine-protein kinase